MPANFEFAGFLFTHPEYYYLLHQVTVAVTVPALVVLVTM